MIAGLYEAIQKVQNSDGVTSTELLCYVALDLMLPFVSLACSGPCRDRTSLSEALRSPIADLSVADLERLVRSEVFFIALLHSADVAWAIGWYRIAIFPLIVIRR